LNHAVNSGVKFDPPPVLQRNRTRNHQAIEPSNVIMQFPIFLCSDPPCFLHFTGFVLQHVAIFLYWLFQLAVVVALS